MCCNPFLKMFVYESRMKKYELETCHIMFILCPHIMRSYFICKCIFQKHSKLSRPLLNKRFFLSVFILLCQIIYFLDWNSTIMNTEPSTDGFIKFIDFEEIRRDMYPFAK